MRILFSPDDTIINKISFNDWGVDNVVLPSEIRDYSLPEGVNEFILFFPTIINQDFALNYDGVEYALHFYFQILRRKHILARIVLLGIESSNSFMMKCSYPKILRCPGFDYILFNKYLVSNYSKAALEIQLTISRNAIEQLGLKLPESYRSNHSFVNEWCYYKWTEYMGYNNCSVVDKLNSNIYFDYLRTILQDEIDIKVSNERKAEIKKLKGKVLLIDDSLYWHDFFSNFFEQSDVEFESLGADFKNIQVDEMVTLCKNKCNEFKPDLILLDFRLNEDKDYDVDERKEISGVKVLNELKGYPEKTGCSFSSRVIIFTATSKINHVLALQRWLADGFILKDHPDSFVGKSTTESVIHKNIILFDKMFACAKIAKHINGSFDNWLLYRIKPNDFLNDKKTNVINKVKHVVTLVRTLMQGDFNEDKKLKLIYLECFSVLESMIKDYEIIHNYIKSFLQKHGLWEKNEQRWNNIRELRNALAHGSKLVKINNVPKKIDDVRIEIYLIDLCEFIDLVLKFYIRRT